MGSAQNGSPWCLIASTGFDTDETVLHDVDPSDTMLPCKSIQSEEDLDRIGVSGSGGKNRHLSRQSFCELNGNSFRFVGSALRGVSELPHVGGRSDVRIFEDAGLIGNVKEILISGPGFRDSLGDRDILLRRVSKKSLPAGKAVVKFFITIGSITLHV